MPSEYIDDKGKKLVHATYRELFGLIRENYSVSLKNMANKRIKPYEQLWDYIMAKESAKAHIDSKDMLFIYIGDQVTDLNFINASPTAKGIIIPNVSNIKTLESKIKECPNVVMSPRDYETILSQIDVYAYDHLKNNKHEKNTKSITVLFDLDDTVHPKFENAQTKAGVEFLEKFCQHSDAYSGLCSHPAAIDIVKNYHKVIKGIDKDGNKIGGSDFKFGAALMTLFKFYNEYKNSPSKKNAFQDYNQLITDKAFLNCMKPFTHDIKSLVKSLKQEGIINLFETATFEDKTFFMINEFRRLEGIHSKKEIRDETVFIFEDIYDLIQAIDGQFNLEYGFVTNKPKEVLNEIYDVPFLVKKGNSTKDYIANI